MSAEQQRSTRLVFAVLRGLRARAGLSVGLLVVAAVAIASAVLGPAYQDAAAQSFLVTRLQEADAMSTGVSVAYQPRGAAEPVQALASAARVTTPGVTRGFSAPSLGLVSTTDTVRHVFGFGYDGDVDLRAKPGGCEQLEVDGLCPNRPGEVLILAPDAKISGVRVGDELPFRGLGGALTVVGTYTVPESAADFWFDSSRLATTPPTASSGALTYSPAPLLVDVSTFDELPADSWRVDLDYLLQISPTTSTADVTAAARAVSELPSALRDREDGRYAVISDNQLGAVVAEIDRNRSIARRTVTPAIVSLVLVALALLARLLAAAADRRRPELALGSLRGMSLRQMWTFGLAEPVAILVVATPIGVAVGYVTTAVLARTWLVQHLRIGLDGTSLLAGALVLVAALAVTALTVGRALAESLSSQLAGVRRPTPGGRAQVVAQMVLVVLAMILVATNLTAPARSAPDSGDLVLPLVLALAAGLLVSRLVVLAAHRWSRRSERRHGIAGFVAARAVSRRREGSLVILPLTAAIAICVFAAGVYAAANTWRASAAATEVGADYAYTSATSLPEAVSLTHEIDPKGQYLMAAGVLDVGDAGEKLILDAPRLGRVGVWPSSWTPGMDGDAVSRALSTHRSALTLAGTRLELKVDNQVNSNVDELGIALSLETATGAQRTVFFGPLSDGPSTARSAALFCRSGCVVEQMSFGGPAATSAKMTGSVTIRSLSVDGSGGDEAFIDPDAWRPVRLFGGELPSTAVPSGGSEGLTVSIDTLGKPDLPAITPSDVPAVRPVLLGRTEQMKVTTTRGDSLLLDTASTDGLPVHPVATTESMPFLGPRGLLVDYTMMARDQGVDSPQMQVFVLSRADTPQRMRELLADRGISSRSSLDTAKRLLDQDAYALSLNLYLVTAVAAIGLALAGLVANLLVQMPDRRRDAAALRVVGVRRRQILQAVFAETCVVLGAAGAAGVAAGALAQFLVVRAVTLGGAEDIRAPRVVATLDVYGLSALAGIVVVVLVVLATSVSALSVQRVRASILRESAR